MAWFDGGGEFNNGDNDGDGGEDGDDDDDDGDGGVDGRETSVGALPLLTPPDVILASPPPHCSRGKPLPGTEFPSRHGRGVTPR